KLQEALDAPQKAYQAHLRELESRNVRRAAIIGAADKPETIEYYKERIKRATEVIPEELNRLRDERRDLVRKIHARLLGIRSTYMDLYASVQKIAAGAGKAQHPLQPQLDASRN